MGTMWAHLQAGGQDMLGILHDKLHVLSHGEPRRNFHMAVEHAHERMKLRILDHTERAVVVGDPDDEAVSETGLRVH